MSTNPDTWPKVLISSLLAPALLVVVGGLYIPEMLAEANELEELRNTRRTKALVVTDQNTEFTNRLNILKTRLLSFHKQNVRRKPSPLALKEASQIFQKEYMDDYLALDGMAWWWYWRLETETQVFDLLSPEEGRDLRRLIEEYGKNVNHCIGAIHPVWVFLSSADYTLDQKKLDEFLGLEEEAGSKLDKLHAERSELVKRISLLFSKSRYRLEEE